MLLSDSLKIDEKAVCYLKYETSRQGRHCRYLKKKTYWPYVYVGQLVI